MTLAARNCKSGIKHGMLILICFLLSFQSFSQESIKTYHFTTQAEVDHFQFNFPGVESLSANLVIDGQDNIINLNGMSNLRSLDGNLELKSGSIMLLKDLRSLSELTGFLVLPDTISESQNNEIRKLIGIQVIQVSQASLKKEEIRSKSEKNYKTNNHHSNHENNSHTSIGKHYIATKQHFSNLAVYPNPTKGDLHFKVKPTGHLMVLDALGQVVHQTDVYSSVLDMSELDAGSYVVVLVKDQSVETCRVMKI